VDVKVVQGTSTTTAVTANGEVGLITCFTSTLAAATAITFTCNNTGTDADSAVFVGIMNYSGAYGTNGFPVVSVNNCIAGTSFDVKVANVHASNALAGVLTIGFCLQ
jgi:hypothetical protein